MNSNSENFDMARPKYVVELIPLFYIRHVKENILFEVILNNYSDEHNIYSWHL